MNNKHMFFCLMSHAGVMISSFKKVHNGTTGDQKLKNERPHRNIFFERKSPINMETSTNGSQILSEKQKMGR